MPSYNLSPRQKFVSEAMADLHPGRGYNEALHLAERAYAWEPKVTVTDWYRWTAIRAARMTDAQWDSIQGAR